MVHDLTHLSTSSWRKFSIATPVRRQLHSASLCRYIYAWTKRITTASSGVTRVVVLFFTVVTFKFLLLVRDFRVRDSERFPRGFTIESVYKRDTVYHRYSDLRITADQMTRHALISFQTTVYTFFFLLL